MYVERDSNLNIPNSARRTQADAQSRWQRITWSDGFWAVIFLFPTFLGLSLVIGSVFGGFLISLTEWDILTTPEWAGLGNYRTMVLEDELFVKSLVNTLYFTVGVVPLGTALSLLAAVVMNQKLKARTLFRTIYFLPTVSSGIAIALLWAWLYNTQFGLVNYLLGGIGIPKIAWLGDTTYAMPAIIIMTIWRGLGYNMVLFLAGLQGIPAEYYEAATIDGANRWQNFRHITLPLLSPTTFFVLILSMIGSFQVFEATYVMTQGGPFYATYTMVLYIFFQGFQWFRMGYASALAYSLFAIILLLTIIQLRFERRWVHYG
ncbi:sugar ABC transporter permease [Chloroflexi bacterium TSY]|nr:sugar ABC transporter permease [Chloroflexi bacterium TSY]